MIRAISRFFTFIIQIIYKQTILVLILFLSIGVSVALLQMSNLSLNLIESQAFQSSALSVSALKNAHSHYSEDVIERIKTIAGINITPDYLSQKGAIPPPISYTIELGNHLSKNESGYLVRLFSDYPFPNRRYSGGIKDDFEQQALDFLRQNPDQAFFRQEDYQNRFSFRYAEAIIMKPSCISCHNSHGDSLKKDWQVGDVRGVIEIAQPIDKFVAQIQTGLHDILIILGVISLFGILSIGLVIAKLRHTTTELESKVKQRTAELESIAISDDLTQIANRRHFNEFLSQEWRKMQHQKLPLSLILCDIDYFKLYNDHYGHVAGDQCLIRVAQAINSKLTCPQDFLARYGGEEFVIVLPSKTIEEAIEIAESVRKSVLASEIIHEPSCVSNFVSLSLGISSIIPNSHQVSELLINAADKALYQAKKRGRNRFAVQQIG